jgi:tetratricopeptide (TPR) repeat protein
MRDAPRSLGRGARWVGLHAVRGPALGVGAALVLTACQQRRPPANQAARNDSAVTARTWGLAYLQENRLPQAEAAFRQVTTLAPDQALGYADLGLVYLREGRYQDAEAQLTRAASLDSANADVEFMLAQVYDATGKTPEARRVLERMVQRDSTDIRAPYALSRLDSASADPAARQRREDLLRRVLARAPTNIVARLELVDLVLARGAADSGAAELEALRQQLAALPREAAPVFQESLRLARSGDASAAAAQALRFHHAMEVTAAYQVSLQNLGGPRGAIVGFPVLSFDPNLTVPTEDARAVARAIRFRDVTPEAGLDGVEPLADSLARSSERGVALAAGDYDGDETEDLFVAGHLFRGVHGRFVETSDPAGLVLHGRATAAAFGDFDNDGQLDLYVATATGAALFKNRGNGGFSDVAAQAGLAGSGPAARALFVDLDHDADLDLFLATPAGNRAYRNQLDGTFVESASAMGLDAVGAAAAASGSRDASFGDFDGDGRTDLVVVAADGRVSLFHNQGQGHFQNVTAAAGLAGASRVGAVAVGDYDNDGLLDLFTTSLGGAAPVLYHNKGDGTFAEDRAGGELARRLSGLQGIDAAFFDFDNDGWLDLVVVGRPSSAKGRGLFLFRNDAGKRFEDFSSILPDSLNAGRAVQVADFDQDGDLDLLVVGLDGGPHLLRNDGGNVNQYVNVRLTALRQGSGKNNDFGLGATLELRAGQDYQLRRVTDRVTHFGLGRHLKADVLRVRWPNGVSQTIYYPGTEQDVLEQQMLKGSCPFLYVWDGHAFTFATDLMWNSALGMPLGIMGSAGGIASAAPYASREYRLVPPGLMRVKDGRYVLQVTEELWETAYLDQMNLLVVDHPDSVHLYLNGTFTPPTAGPASLRLYQVTHPITPRSAVDQDGHDLLPALRKADDVYASRLQPTRYQGLMTLHDLVLDLGDVAGRDSVFLFLTGYIYPTDASINFALAQAKTAQVVPAHVQVKDGTGQWRTVIPDIGFPAGKNKTVVVDLTGKFLSADHHVRIRTNMAIYWDRAFVATTASRSPVTVTTLQPMSADLHYRGYSRMYRKGGRYGPEWFAYNDVSRAPRWAPIEGAFTRYGDALPLLTASDDMYAIFGPGDEITVQFDAARAPPLPAGWTRDYVLYTDSWLKDSDLNTATGTTVGPLPFHAMSRYPYGSDERYPEDAAHRRYLQTYDTRVVGRPGPRSASAGR